MHEVPKIVYLTLKGGVLQDPPLGLKRINYTLGPIGLNCVQIVFCEKKIVAFLKQNNDEN